MAKPRIENETKEEKFKRIVSLRTQKALDALRSIGKCSNKSIYSYSETDIRKIFSAIEEEIRNVKNLFKGKDKNKKFTL